MKLYKLISNSVYFFIAAVSSLLLTSCGSYQYAGNTPDGIYGDNEGEVSSNEEIAYGTREENTGYYKKLFEEEAALYGDVLAEDAVFTDVDSYSSTGNYDYENAQNSNYQGGNAPWGNSPDRYTINVFNDPFYGGYYDRFWLTGYAYDPYFFPGYYGPGFYRPNYYGPGFYGPGFYGNPYYDRGYYGYGFGFNSFIYGGSGWYNPYNSYYSRQHYFRQNVAYTSGRRGESSYYSDRTSAVRNAANLNDRGRSSTYSRSIRNLRNSNDEYGITRRSSRSYDTSVGEDGQYNRGRNSSGVSTPSRRVYSTTNRTSTTRSQSPATRSSSSTTRSSSSGSSSTGRSSSSSTSGRSSGSNRGRGN